MLKNQVDRSSACKITQPSGGPLAFKSASSRPSRLEAILIVEWDTVEDCNAMARGAEGRCVLEQRAVGAPSVCVPGLVPRPGSACGEAQVGAGGFRSYNF